MWSVKNISGDDWCLYSDSNYRNQLLVVLDGQAFDVASPVRDQVTSVTEC